MTVPVVRIERLAAGGDGVGRLEDGRVVFVPRSAPGDRVELVRLESRNRFARAMIGRLVEPGPGRIEPRCPHYVAEHCGGCQLQHLAVSVQRDAKRQIVADALTRIAKIQVEVPALVPSGQDWEYRSRIHLAVGPGRRFAGFHPLDDPGRVFPLEHCHIAAPAVMQLWQRLAPLLHLLPADADQLQLRLDPEGIPHVVVRTPGGRAWTEGKHLGERLGSPGVVWWHPADGAPRVVAGGLEAYPATVFAQVNPETGAAIRRWALEQLGEVQGQLVWDLYAGTGETTDALGAGGARVESVELDRRAVEQAERRAPATARRHAGRAEDLVSRLPDPALVVTNPPRTGMDKAVVAEIARRRPGRVVYISCDPATLARDVAGLSPAYRVVAVQPFDLFPQTAHVETVVTLEVT